MCKAFEDAIEEGRVKGHAEGHAEGHAKGHAEGKRERSVEAIKSLMVNLKFTVEQAMDALSIPENEQEEYLPLI